MSYLINQYIKYLLTNYNINSIKMSIIIKLNVSGKLFEVQKEIICKSNMFENILGDICYNDEIININRSAKIFKHVYAYLIDNKYPYPQKYESELKYYLIEYEYDQLYDPMSKIIAELNSIKKQIIELIKECDEYDCDQKCLFNSEYCSAHLKKCEEYDCGGRCDIDYKYCIRHHHYGH